MPHLRPSIALLALLLPGIGLGGPPQASKLPPDVAARIGPDEITMHEYEDYLVLAFGRGPLQDLIDRRLLHTEADRRGVTVSDDQVSQAFESTLASYLVRLKGDEQAFVRELEASGRTRAEYRLWLWAETEDRLLAELLCQATRVVTDAAVRERFARDFGADGERVQVRHIVLTPTRTRALMIQEGTPASRIAPEAVEARMRERMAEILRELADGADFAELAGRESHDISAKKLGGALPGYNYLTYGPEFAAAVRAAEVGVPLGPVETRAGFHVIEVTSRVHTELADVRAALVRALEEEPASSAEVDALAARLRAAVAIETF